MKLPIWSPKVDDYTLWSAIVVVGTASRLGWKCPEPASREGTHIAYPLPGISVTARAEKIRAK